MCIKEVQFLSTNPKPCILNSCVWLIHQWIAWPWVMLWSQWLSIHHEEQLTVTDVKCYPSWGSDWHLWQSSWTPEVNSKPLACCSSCHLPGNHQDCRWSEITRWSTRESWIIHTRPYPYPASVEHQCGFGQSLLTGNLTLYIVSHFGDPETQMNFIFFPEHKKLFYQYWNCHAFKVI